MNSKKAFAQSINEYYKQAYPLNRGSGDGNLFRFFVERNLSLLKEKASLNYVLPSALMLEEGSLALRTEILENKNLAFFYSFENREGIFEDVHRSYKFALMQVKNTKAKNHTIKTMFYQTKVESIYDKDNIIKLTLKDIKTLSPNQLALQEVRSKKDLEILRKCYEAFEPLSLEWLDFRRELDMTNDKDLFIESYREGLFPLFEGKMIHQFSAYFSEPQYFLNPSAFDKRLKSKEIYRLKQDLGLETKEYERLIESSYPQISKEKAENAFITYDRNFYRLGFRAVASDTNERTAIFSLLPKNVGCGNTLWVSVPKQYILDSHSHITIKPVSTKRILFALGIFNALVVDFIARSMVQIHLNKTYISRIPLPQPSDEEIERNYAFIYKTALILQLYNDKTGQFKELQDKYAIKNNEIPNTQKSYDTLRAKLDIHIAKLYGLSKTEFAILLESFKVLKSKQPEYIALLQSLWE